MQFNSQRLAVLVPLAAITALVSPHAAMAQGQAAGYGEVMTTVYGAPPADLAGMPAGPVVEGIISARNDDKMRVSASDGTSTVIHVSEGTQIKGTKGLFDGNRAEVARKVLINGLPVSVKTVRWGNGLVASEVRYKKKDLKIATMIHNGTAQGFADQAAATEALRARMGDIDKYNIKRTTNVYFDVGKTVLSARAKSDLCATAAEASAMDNAVMLVLGYTDSTGSEEVNQAAQREARQPGGQLPPAGLRLEALSHAHSHRHGRSRSTGGQSHSLWQVAEPPGFGERSGQQGDGRPLRL
jgi:OOP family OmpA-OmpF porin